jgi:threonine/homoserine/homoserine lactone efflux protein
MSSGASFGLRATVPFLSGVSIGFPLMLLAVAVGLGGVLKVFPDITVLLKAAGTLYLLWLAWKIATASDLGIDAAARARPIGFVQACLFQWVNPKAWIIAIGGLSAYATPDRLWQVVVAFMAIFFIVCWSSTAAWAAFGVAVGRLLKSPSRIRLFNLAMALLLVASLWPTVRETFGAP